MKKTSALVLALLVFPAFTGIAHAAPSLVKVPKTSISDSISAAMPSVVSIVETKNIERTQTIYQTSQRNFRGMTVVYTEPIAKRTITRPAVVGVGSGFVGTRDGEIVTAAHVVDDPQATYDVILSNGMKLPATVKYRDDAKDIAVVKVNATFGNVATLGDSSSIKRDDHVVAIGTAYGKYDQTLAQGKVVGFDQSIVAKDNKELVKLTGVVETSIPVVPGYSGGPVVNTNGTVIGMNVAADVYSGRGFYVPVNEIKRAIQKSRGMASAPYPMWG